MSRTYLVTSYMEDDFSIVGSELHEQSDKRQQIISTAAVMCFFILKSS